VQVIFDIDGVLVDSRAAVRAAYASAGIDMPEDAWDKPWQDWLTKMVGSYDRAVMIHSAKNNSYLTHLSARVTPLFPSVVAHELIENGHRVCIATGASKVACDAVLEQLGLRQSVRVLGTCLKLGQKKSNVRAASRDTLKKRGEFTIYVDDNAEIVSDIKKWELPHLKAIRYAGNDDKFVEEFEQTWTLLSSLPGRMNGSRAS
jgi:phosphoglycolate phosphatase-like HAD superfamily hydrolase